MRAAVVQVRSGGDKAANLARLAGAVAAAADQGAELVVAPEVAMHGYGRPGTDLAAVAEPLDGPFVAELAHLAHAHRLTVVAGMFEARGHDERVHNTVVAVGPGGLVARYRKLHLYDALGWCESDRVAPGDPADGVPVFDAGDLVVGLVTCYDLRFPEVARLAAAAGATALAVPAAWVAGPGKAAQWEVLLRARAIENTLYVLAAGQPAPSYTGRSMVVGPAGAVVARLGAGTEGPAAGVLVADLAAAEVAEVRAGMPVLAQRRFAVVPASMPPQGWRG